MHFNVYLDDATGQLLNNMVKKLHKPRNAIIREAVQNWVVNKGKKEWPKEVLEFQGIPNMPPLESYRIELIPPKENIFT